MIKRKKYNFNRDATNMQNQFRQFQEIEKKWYESISFKFENGLG